MKKLRNLLGILGLIITFNSIAVEIEEVYEYDNYTNILSPGYFTFEDLTNSLTLNFEESFAFHSYGEYAPISACGDPIAYFCVKSLLFTFAIPRKGIAVGDGWVIDNHYFVVTSKKNIQILGDTYPTYVIEKTHGEALIYRYYYSINKGVIAFSERECRGKRLPSKYFLRGSRGVAANVLPQSLESP